MFDIFSPLVIFWLGYKQIIWGGCKIVIIYYHSTLCAANVALIEIVVDARRLEFDRINLCRCIVKLGKFIWNIRVSFGRHRHNYRLLWERKRLVRIYGRAHKSWRRSWSARGKYNLLTASKIGTFKLIDSACKHIAGAMGGFVIKN